LPCFSGRIGFHVGIDAGKGKKTRYHKSRVPHLYIDRLTGMYYARAADGKGRNVYRSLETKFFALAKEKVLSKVAEIQAGMNGRSEVLRSVVSFQAAAEIYRGRVQALTGLKAASIQYRLSTIDGLLRSWPELKSLSLRSITTDACLGWAKQIARRSTAPDLTIR
jgi:hypothetical protein